MSIAPESSLHDLSNELLLMIIEQVRYDIRTFLASIRGINRQFAAADDGISAVRRNGSGPSSVHSQFNYIFFTHVVVTHA